MKLSEAILLGSTILEAKAGQQHYSELNAGCALGMAAVAAGYTFKPVATPFEERDRRTLGTEAVWGAWVLDTFRRPCNCWRFRVPRDMRIKDIIAHIFDRHVMGRKDWTLEQLSAWVESVEPKNKAPQSSGPETRRNGNPFERQPFTQPQFQPLQEELEEWQAVRSAIEGTRDPNRKPRVLG